MICSGERLFNDVLHSVHAEPKPECMMHICPSTEFPLRPLTPVLADVGCIRGLRWIQHITTAHLQPTSTNSRCTPRRLFRMKRALVMAKYNIRHLHLMSLVSILYIDPSMHTLNTIGVYQAATLTKRRQTPCSQTHTSSSQNSPMSSTSIPSSTGAKKAASSKSLPFIAPAPNRLNAVFGFASGRVVKAVSAWSICAK